MWRPVVVQHLDQVALARLEERVGEILAVDRDHRLAADRHGAKVVGFAVAFADAEFEAVLGAGVVEDAPQIVAHRPVEVSAPAAVGVGAVAHGDPAEALLVHAVDGVRHHLVQALEG